MSHAEDADEVVSPRVIAIERAMNELTYFSARARQHERLMSVAGLSLDRSAAATLRYLADAEPIRAKELAARLSVEPSHVTRQVQALERTGHVERTRDAEDNRAVLIRLTDTGREAVERMRTASRHGMQQVLADWSDADVDQLSSLFRRMVDDFVAHAEDESRFRFR